MTRRCVAVSALPTEAALSMAWWPEWLLRAALDPDFYKAPFRDGVPVAAVDELDDVIARMEALLEPAPLDAIKTLLIRLLNHYKAPDRSEAEFLGMCEDMLEDLDWLSEPCMREVCRRARRSLKFFPRSAELMPLAHDVAEPIRLRLDWLRAQRHRLLAAPAQARAG